MSLPLRIARDPIFNQVSLRFVEETFDPPGQPMNVTLPAFDIACSLTSHGVVKQDGCAWLCETAVPEQLIGEVPPPSSDAYQTHAGRLSEESLQAPFFHHFFGQRQDESILALPLSQKITHKCEDEDGDESTTCGTCDSLPSLAETPPTSFCDAESSGQTTPPTSFHGNTDSNDANSPTIKVLVRQLQQFLSMAKPTPARSLQPPRRVSSRR
jgi:hypothetical protein